MKFKKLDEWSSGELLIFGIVFMSIGFVLGSFFQSKGIVIQILSIFIMFTGLIFFVVGISRLLIKLEQKGKIEILREKPPKSFKGFISIIIPLLILTLIIYWFEIRPRQITSRCFKESLSTGIDYQECLKKYNLGKYLEK